MAKILLGPIDQFTPGSLRRVEVSQRALAFAVAVMPEGTIRVIDDLCTHANARLSDGWLEDGCLACPWHGAQFDLETGRALSLPATGRVPTHQPVVEDGFLYVEAATDDDDRGPRSSEGLDEAHLDR